MFGNLPVALATSEESTESKQTAGRELKPIMSLDDAAEPEPDGATPSCSGGKNWATTVTALLEHGWEVPSDELRKVPGAAPPSPSPPLASTDSTIPRWTCALQIASTALSSPHVP